MLLRMQRTTDIAPHAPPAGLRIVPYEAARHYDSIPALYAAAFGDPPWPADWDHFDEFDPRGVFLGYDPAAPGPVGFAISFQRQDFGYISVVAVLPAYRRRGLATALIGTAVQYLGSLALKTVHIDVLETNRPAVLAYEKLGFQVYAVLQE